MGHANQQRSIKFTDVPDDPSMLLLQSRNTTYEYLQILGFKAASFAEDPDLRAVYDIFVGRYNHILEKNTAYLKSLINLYLTRLPIKEAVSKLTNVASFMTQN